MRLEDLEPHFWTVLEPWQMPVTIAGVVLAVACVPLIERLKSKRGQAAAATGFTAGLLMVVLAFTAPQAVPALPTSDAMKSNAAAITAWAEDTYDVEIKTEIAERYTRTLVKEGSMTREFPVEGPDGDQRVRIEVRDGQLTMTGTREIPRVD